LTTISREENKFHIYLYFNRLTLAFGGQSLPAGSDQDHRFFHILMIQFLSGPGGNSGHTEHLIPDQMGKSFRK